jgi:predicted NBD/HSP70 family sugar kinase
MTREDNGPGDLLAVLRRAGACTRSDLVQRTGLARATVSQRLDALVAAGYVVRVDGASTGGRPPEIFRFHSTGGVVLAADIGGSHTRVGVTDLAGELLAEDETDLDVTRGPEEVLGWVRTEFARLLESAGRTADQVRGIGIGVPGPVEFETGMLVSPPIMTGWDGFVVPDFFAADYTGPVVVDKDVNVMALGEHRNAWSGHPHMLMLKVGMGIGCGIVANGELVRGAQGSAGDVGHIPRGDDRPCRCGYRGCTEATAGGWAIARDLAEAGYEVQTSEQIVALTRSGNTEAVTLVRQAGRVLGEVVADLVGVLNPSVVVVGGNLSACREPLLAGIREVVYSRSQPLATRDLQLTYSRLLHQAGLVGASLLVRDAIFAPHAVNVALGH